MTVREYFVEHYVKVKPEPDAYRKAFTLWADGKPIGVGTFEQLVPDYGDMDIIDIKGSRIDIEWKIKTEYPDC